MVKIDVIRRRDELPGVKLLHDGLLGETHGAAFAQSFDWLAALLDDADPHLLQPHLLIVSVGGEAIGMLPLVLRSQSSRFGPLRVLGYPWPGSIAARGPLGPNPTATLAAAMRYLTSAPREWDVIDLRGIDVRGGDFGRTEAALDRVGLSARKTVWFDVTQLEAIEQCPTTNDQDETPGRLHWHRPQGARFGDDDPAFSMLEQGLALPRRAGPLFADQPALKMQISEARHRAAARAGGLEMGLLSVDGRPCAWWYAHRANDRLDPLGMTWDAALDRSAAAACLARFVSSSSNDRPTFFGPGWPAWMIDGAAGSRGDRAPRPLFRFTHFARAARPQLARFGGLLARR